MSTPRAVWMTTAEAAHVLNTDGSVIRQWLQRDFFLACFAALDPERATLPVAPRGKPQPSGSCTHAAARPTATDAASGAETPRSAPGGTPTTTLAPGSGAPAGGASSSEADARVARPIISAACRGGGGHPCS